MNTNHKTKHQNETKTKTQLASSAGDPAAGRSGELCELPRGRSGKVYKLLKAKAPSAEPSEPADVIKVGLDMGLRKYVYCRQVDSSLQDAPRGSSPEKFMEWILKQKPLAARVVVCYEAGLFGFELARWLRAQQIQCVVMAPVKLDEAHSRVETDKLNARDICGRLDRYLAGNTRALTACRIPSREEELARHQTRQRQQLVEHRQALEAQGRCLLWQFGYWDQGQQRWWSQARWEPLSQGVEPVLVEGLGRLRALILEIERQVQGLVGQLRAQAEQSLPQPLKQAPVGMGWLSLLTLSREIMDWHRFRNRRQMGDFSGLVPSEGSTGESVRRGSITKVGNRVVRRLLIEMAWRMVRYQRHCRAVEPWQSILREKKAGARARKKAIVAVARRLAVDIWRLATGQTTPQKLGFVV